MVGSSHLDHQVERQVRDVGERVPRVDGERGEDGVDLALEDVDEVVAVVVVERRTSPRGGCPASARAGTMHVQEDVVLAAHQLLDPAPDERELLARAQAVDRAGAHARGHLVLEGGHPDLVELVEQLGEDGEELGPLEQREPVVLGQVEQAGPEIEPRLLPVGEALVPERLDLLVGRRGRPGVVPAPASRRCAGRHLGRFRLGLGRSAPRGWWLGLGLGHVRVVRHAGAARRGMSPSILPPTTTIRPWPSRTRRMLRLPRYHFGPKPKRRTELGPARLRLAAHRRPLRPRRARARIEDPRQHRRLPRRRPRAGPGRPHGQPLAGPQRQRGRSCRWPRCSTASAT